MESQTEVTRKDLNFINDTDLRNILRDRLEELDRVFLVNGHCSTVFLAVGCIEGAFKHIAEIFKTEIKASSKYPKKSNGQPKDFNDLTIDELRLLLAEQNILPNIPNFEHVYNVFRNYRNFVHPQAHTRKKWELAASQAQMAVGLLNATISELADYIFIGKDRFSVIAGKPDYDSSKILTLDRTEDSALQSFVVLDREIANTLSLSFTLDLPPGSVFNFVFNYRNDGDFKMLRLDNRKPNLNRLLQCTQKYKWRPTHRTFPECPSDSPMQIIIEIDVPNRVFSFTQNSHTQTGPAVYRITDFDANPRDINNEISPHRKIGFFNEAGTVRLSDISLRTT
jgi:hypothetical protein